MQLWFRVDASEEIGAGHFMRCLALAERWRDEGGAAGFVGSIPPGLVGRLARERVEHVALDRPHPDPADLGQTLQAIPPGAPVVVDGYGFDAGYHRRLGQSRRPVLVIDDMARLPSYECDLLLNCSLGAERARYARAPATRLLGVRYLPLRRAFLRWARWEREIPGVAANVVVTLGGADPTGATPRVVEALGASALAGTTVRVVAGPASSKGPDLERLARDSDGRFEVLSNVSDMPALMAWADFAVTAAGGTALEMAYMGLPCAVIAVADNQVPNAEGLAGVGAAVDVSARDDLAACVDGLLRDARERERMSRRGRELIDGRGAERVVACLRGLLLD